MAQESERVQVTERMSLRWQVILAMALALSPLLILGGVRVLAEHQETRERRYQELVEVSREGLSTVNASIQAIRLALKMIAKDDRQPSCADIGDSLISADLPIRNVLRFNTDGEVICNFVGDNLIGQPMPDPEWNDQLLKGVDELESAAFLGLALGEPVIWLVRRTGDPAGNYTGSLAFTVSLQTLSDSLPDIMSATGMEQGLVTLDGAVIGSNFIDQIPLEWLSGEATLEREAQQLVLPQGRRLDVVVLPSSAEGVWLITPSSTPLRPRLENFIVLTIPVLAYLAALLASTWIIDTMVLRWLERLRLRISDMRRAADFQPLGPDLAGAPAELQQLAKAFDDLTGRVDAHESDLRHALIRMKGAFRETHHRVKNNLQVMLSMLKLQVRGEHQPETQKALRIAAQRVSMMAAVHHSLLNETHLEIVDARDLVDAICNQIHEQQGWGEESRHIRPEVDDGPLPSDLAVPLAMFIQEAFDLLCPITDTGTVIRDLRLTLRREEGQVRLRMSCGHDTTPGLETSRERDTNLFLQAFARQVDGQVEQLGDDPDNVIIELVFPLAPVPDEPAL